LSSARLTPVSLAETSNSASRSVSAGDVEERAGGQAQGGVVDIEIAAVVEQVGVDRAALHRVGQGCPKASPP
jgi:hypothetical protein